MPKPDIVCLNLNRYRQDSLLFRFWCLEESRPNMSWEGHDYIDSGLGDYQTQPSSQGGARPKQPTYQVTINFRLKNFTHPTTRDLPHKKPPFQHQLSDHHVKRTWYRQRMISNVPAGNILLSAAIMFIGSSNQWDPFTMIRSWFLSPSCGNSSRSTQCVTGRAKSRSQGNEVPL